MNQLIKFNQKKYGNDANIIWDEFFAYEYEHANEFGFYYANTLCLEHDELIDDMDIEYFEY